MPGSCSEIKDEFLSYLPTISLHQITSLKIDDPLDLCQLRLLLSKMINLRTLQLNYYFNYNLDDDSNKQYLIDLLNDTSLCTIHMSNGLQKLHLYTDWKYPDMIGIAFLIVKGLPHLQIIELNCHNNQVPETLHILMNGLSKLTFLIFHGRNEQLSKMRDLQKYSTRAYRMEFYNELAGDKMLYVWL
jgi:hypothetical protein